MSHKIFLSVEWFNQAEISSYGMTSDQYNGQSVSNKSLLRPTLFSHSPGKGGVLSRGRGRDARQKVTQTNMGRVQALFFP